MICANYFFLSRLIQRPEEEHFVTFLKCTWLSAAWKSWQNMDFLPQGGRETGKGTALPGRQMPFIMGKYILM